MTKHHSLAPEWSSNRSKLAYEAFESFASLTQVHSGTVRLAILFHLSPGVADLFENLMPVPGFLQKQACVDIFAVTFKGTSVARTSHRFLSIREPRPGAWTLTASASFHILGEVFFTFSIMVDFSWE